MRVREGQRSPICEGELFNARKWAVRRIVCDPLLSSLRIFNLISDLKMPAVFGARLTTFEDSEKESEYGYVRKVSVSSPLHFPLFFIQIQSLYYSFTSLHPIS